MSFSARDQTVIWHPYTQHQTAMPPLTITKGDGAYLFDEAENSYLDMISSWWVNVHGHAHPQIAKAIYEQACQLEHVIFSGFTHGPAVQLAENLLQEFKSPFSRIFYSDNGSTAVEVALKMAYQYWYNLGEKQRCKFVAFEHAYHGDTFGGMAVGKSSGFYQPFHELLFSVDLFPFPDTWLSDEHIQHKEQQTLEKIADYFKQHGHEVAAIIIEPLIQGSSGMRMCRSQFLQALEQLCHEHHVLIIYDEVMTGMGRTGAHFAFQKARTTPDIICLAKGLTGGFLPLAVTACHEKIYNAFLSNTFEQAFAHGHSFTANPLGCAAALASLEILQSAYTQSQLSMIERVHHEQLSTLPEVVEKQRYCGTIAAFELKAESGYGTAMSLELRKRFLKKGLLLRPLGNVIYLMPPYCIDEKDLQRAYEIIKQECVEFLGVLS